MQADASCCISGLDFKDGEVKVFSMAKLVKG
jgi:hypothetical protein